MDLFSSSEELNKERADVLAKAMLSPIIAVDTESNGKDVRSGEGFCIGISIAFRYEGKMYSSYYPVAHTNNNIPDDMRRLLNAVILSRKALIFHGAKFDLVSLKTAGIDIRKAGIKWYCTMIMAHFMNENLMSKGLDYLSKHLLKRPGKAKGPDWQWAFNIFGWSDKFPSQIMHKYASTDAEETYLLFEGGYKEFFEAGFDGTTPIYNN